MAGRYDGAATSRASISLMRDRVLILSVFVAASCGLAYELIAGALTSYLLGDSVLQFSSVIGCYLFAMGVGSHLSRYVKDEDALQRFIEIELLVGLVGGASATILFLVYAWMSGPFREAMYALVFVIGVLVGIGASRLTAVFAGFDAIVSTDSIVLAFSVSFAIGVFFGIYPARKAAALNPIDALRYE